MPQMSHSTLGSERLCRLRSFRRLADRQGRGLPSRSWSTLERRPSRAVRWVDSSPTTHPLAPHSCPSPSHPAAPHWPRARSPCAVHHSHTLVSALVHLSSGRIAAQLAGRLGAARVAAPMATTASRVDARAASSLGCPLWPYPLIALVCTQHTAHCTIFLAPLGAAVPEAYGRRAVEVRILLGPPLWDVATLSLTLTLTLTL